LGYIGADGGGRMYEQSPQTMSGIQKARVMKAEVFLPNDYLPVEGEPFMNDRQLEYFRRRLLNWKAELLDDSKHTIEGLQDGTRNIPDVADRASEETDRALELRTRDRQRKLVTKIDSALRRIDEGEYGYCAVTGDSISLKRLEARPIATMSLEAQESHERREKVHRDD
jgi:DnaK suppressor protein